MSKQDNDFSYIVGFLDRENILKYAFCYTSKKEALKEFEFNPEEEDPLIGTVFLAKIERIQKREKVEKFHVTTSDVSGNILSNVTYDMKDYQEEVE